MIVYHGSDVIVDKPQILEAVRPLDFGGGFYVTTSKEQAIAWAKKVSYRNGTKFCYINLYDFDLAAAEDGLRIIRFDKPDVKWLDFICANRSRRTLAPYDLVIGPVADDKVYRVVINYENGIYDKDEALKRLKTEELCDQILFHNRKALGFLKFRTWENVL